MEAILHYIRRGRCPLRRTVEKPGHLPLGRRTRVVVSFTFCSPDQSQLQLSLRYLSFKIDFCNPGIWHTGECQWYTTGCHICCWKVHFNVCLWKIEHQLEKVAQGTDLIRSPVDQDHEGCKESREFEECLQDSFLLNLFWVTSDTGINKFCLDSQCYRYFGYY